MQIPEPLFGLHKLGRILRNNGYSICHVQVRIRSEGLLSGGEKVRTKIEGTHKLRRFSIRQFYSDGHRDLRARELTSWKAKESCFLVVHTFLSC